MWASLPQPEIKKIDTNNPNAVRDCKHKDGNIAQKRIEDDTELKWRAEHTNTEKNKE